MPAALFLFLFLTQRKGRPLFRFLLFLCLFLTNKLILLPLELKRLLRLCAGDYGAHRHKVSAGALG